MKKLFSIIFSLIFVLASFSPCFAEQVLIINPYTGEVVNQDEGSMAVSTEGKIRIDTNCIYNTDDRMYVYNSGSPTSEVEANVVSGMITTDYVSLVVAESAKVAVYNSGEEVPREEWEDLRTPGNYIVRDTYVDSEILRFTIVHKVTGAIDKYKVPDVFYVSEVYKNGEKMDFAGSTVDMKEDGHYIVYYSIDKIAKKYTLDVRIDHAAPQLMIYGVNEEGIANSTVTFGPTEDNSTITIERDGEFVVISDELKDAGDYRVIYTDEAGNSVTYYFTIHFFLDAGGWIYVALFIVLLGGALWYYFHSRKHLRTC